MSDNTKLFAILLPDFYTYKMKLKTIQASIITWAFEYDSSQWALLKKLSLHVLYV